MLPAAKPATAIARSSCRSAAASPEASCLRVVGHRAEAQRRRRRRPAGEPCAAGPRQVTASRRVVRLTRASRDRGLGLRARARCGARSRRSARPRPSGAAVQAVACRPARSGDRRRGRGRRRRPGARPCVDGGARGHGREVDPPGSGGRPRRRPRWSACSSHWPASGSSTSASYVAAVRCGIVTTRGRGRSWVGRTKAGADRGVLDQLAVAALERRARARACARPLCASSRSTSQPSAACAAPSSSVRL